MKRLIQKMLSVSGIHRIAITLTATFYMAVMILLLKLALYLEHKIGE